MQEAINKAAALVEAHEYIRRFNGKTIVVKVGGSIMDEPKKLSKLIVDVCFLKAVGMRPIVVHGGGKSITEAMEKAGLEAQFVQGRRYTDDGTLAIAEDVLVNQINTSLVEQINALKHKAMGLHSLSSCAVFARKLYLSDDGEAGRRQIDIGLVGEVERVNVELLNALIEANCIPVIAPIAAHVGDASAGPALNVNADTAAGEIAAAIGADSLVMLTDVAGVLDTSRRLLPRLTERQARSMVSSSVVAGGMVPKLEACIAALGQVRSTHIVDGRKPHVLRELLAGARIGTRDG